MISVSIGSSATSPPSKNDSILRSRIIRASGKICHLELFIIYNFLFQGPLPLRDDNGIVLLGERAAKCRAYAKALHYKELEFQKGPTPLILESLIR